jgi:hypothetical protein
MKPVVWIHKASGRIRFDGKDLPDSWIPLYAQEDLELDPLKGSDQPDLPAKTRKIWAYIKTLKQPVSTNVIANHFAITAAAAAKHLSALKSANLLQKKRVGAQVVWPVVKTHEPIAPKKEPVLKTIPFKPEVTNWPTSTFTTSYPHARGYDD